MTSNQLSLAEINISINWSSHPPTTHQPPYHPIHKTQFKIQPYRLIPIPIPFQFHTDSFQYFQHFNSTQLNLNSTQPQLNSISTQLNLIPPIQLNPNLSDQSIWQQML